MSNRLFCRLANSRRGFTLVELLVAIGLIAILIALLLPAVRLANDHAKGVVCQSHQRQLWQGFLLFATDHDGHIPGGWLDMGNPDPDKRDWLLGKYNTYDHGPQDGTLFKYVDKNYQIYRCPSLDLAPPSANDSGFRGGSNGRFDYAVFLCFAGARLDRLPPSAHPPPNPQTGLPYSPEWVPTPVICEEGPYRINGFNTEGGHANVDQMAHNHNGGSYYMAPDGACHWYNEPWVNVNQYAANDWYAPGPSGKLQSMGLGLSWGQWDGK